MSAGRTFRAMVVDDEPAAREAVRTFLDRIPRVEVIGEATTGREAVERIRALGPDLLFLDVQMPDLDGFAVLEELGRDVPAGIVLVTAHDEYAQRAFEVHALDYVMKPFGRPRFMAAVERALRRLEAEEALGLADTLQALIRSVRLREGEAGSVLGVPAPTEAPPARIGVRVGTRTTLIEVAEIDWVEADRDLLRVHAAGKVHLVSGRMQELEHMLARGRFHRIHRSTIVNLDRIQVLDRERDGGGAVVLADGVRLRVARGRWEELERVLGVEWKG
ncbi:MAG: LytTR family DNA-binding domain-containing protein [Gemmatimonadota bacterium]